MAKKRLLMAVHLCARVEKVLRWGGLTKAFNSIQWRRKIQASEMERNSDLLAEELLELQVSRGTDSFKSPPQHPSWRNSTTYIAKHSHT